MLVFWVFPEQLLSHIMFERLHCYEVTLVNKYNKPLLQKSETRIFDQTRFHKKLAPRQRKKLWRFEVKSDNVYIADSKQMSGVKLQANSAVICNCYLVLNMPSIFTSNISHTT